MGTRKAIAIALAHLKLVVLSCDDGKRKICGVVYSCAG